MPDKINMDMGTASFWIKGNTVSFDDNKFYQLFKEFPLQGSIFILKDTDNKIKIFYVYIGKGRVDVEWDCSKLPFNERHMIAVTWDIVDSKKLVLYVDGKLVASSNMKF